VHELVEAYYSSLQASELHASLHQKLTAAARGALKKARSRVTAFQQQLAAAEGVGAVQRRADIIMANVYRWVGGWWRLVRAGLRWARNVSSQLSQADGFAACCGRPQQPDCAALRQPP
jgi:hypothetical protein